MQKHLVEAFAGCAVVLQSVNARILLGEPVDIADQSAAARTLVRIASHLGIERVPHAAGDIVDGKAVPLPWSPLRQRLAEAARIAEAEDVLP